ncbi:MAG: ABC transporter ATP-binding protein [Candidatus Kapabacteria bacterium]|nr:ABC transporter ATP-binding protein [Candidatus Kapabacteria bacterium]
MTLISLTDVQKSYADRLVLRSVSVSAKAGDVVGVLGANGSGKSTLMRIIAGVLRADCGSVELVVNGTSVSEAHRPFVCGYVAPYLNLYDEFSSRELLAMHAHLHRQSITSENVEELLHRVGLDRRMDDVVKTFSSGMRQRVAIALAVSLNPSLLLLDEPSTNLDTEGRTILANEIRSHRQRGGIVFLATNDERERVLCTQSVSVSPLEQPQ